MSGGPPPWAIALIGVKTRTIANSPRRRVTNFPFAEDRLHLRTQTTDPQNIYCALSEEVTGCRKLVANRSREDIVRSHHLVVFMLENVTMPDEAAGFCLAEIRHREQREAVGFLLFWLKHRCL